MNWQRNQIIVSTAACIASFTAGAIVSRLLVEQKLRSEYEESAQIYRNAMDRMKAHGIDDIKLDENQYTRLVESDLVDLNVKVSVESPEGAVAEFTPTPVNPYHTPVDPPDDVATNGQVGYVNLESNEYGISFIDEEDFLEEDGRFKGSVTIVMDPHQPTFYISGEGMDDWFERLGPNIVPEFLARIPKDSHEPVLYIRNHELEEDFEIKAEHP